MSDESIEIDVSDLEGEAERVFTKRELDSACAKARRKAEGIAAEARAEADQLRAELDRLKNPPASIPLDDLDRPISFERFDEMVKAQIRPLRQWLSIDWRLKEK